MITIRPDQERGRTRLGWLDSRHSFSFGQYQDPEHPGFGTLRVINEDRVQPAGGFGQHPHRDMEILTWVLGGALRHEDNLGNGSVIRVGDLQRMTAGTGIVHSEMNDSSTEPVHFLQIWILPAEPGLAPSYDQRSFNARERHGRLQLIATGNPGGETIRVHQDVELYAALLDPGQMVAHPLRAGRRAWLQVAGGAVEVNGRALGAGDGAGVVDEDGLEIGARDATELLLFDLA